MHFTTTNDDGIKAYYHCSSPLPPVAPTDHVVQDVVDVSGGLGPILLAAHDDDDDDDNDDEQ